MVTLKKKHLLRIGSLFGEQSQSICVTMFNQGLLKASVVLGLIPFLVKIFYFQQLHVLILMNAKLTKMYVGMENVKTWWAHLIVFAMTDIQSKKN